MDNYDNVKNTEGLPGLYAAEYSKHVYLTDADQSVVDMSLHNILLNELCKKSLISIITLTCVLANVSAHNLRWGDDASLQSFAEKVTTDVDIVLGSDILNPLR